jgi:hypothetical protein
VPQLWESPTLGDQASMLIFGLWRIENPRTHLNKDVNRTSGGKFLSLLTVVVCPLYTCTFHSYTCACVVVEALLLSIVIRVVDLFLWLA